ncbi:MAG: hypothetical protein RL518_1635 [Pseudomonadota bacterium]|jgi:hypothetical protein
MSGYPESTQQGWALPTTLFGLTLILATIRLLSIDATQATQMLSDIRRAHTLRQYALGEILAAGEPKPLCEQRAITLEETTMTYEVCGERKVPFMVAPPSAVLPLTRIDYDAIFVQAIRCPIPPSSATDPFEASPTASKDCGIPTTLKGGVILLENIRGESIKVLPPSSGASVIASPGRITVTGALSLESDLVMVAGGDVEIGSITTQSGHTRKVTILSALGGIRVSSITPGIEVLAAGRNTLEVPNTPHNPPFPLPPQRGHEIVGLRAMGE